MKPIDEGRSIEVPKDSGKQELWSETCKMYLSRAKSWAQDGKTSLSNSTQEKILGVMVEYKPKHYR